VRIDFKTTVLESEIQKIRAARVARTALVVLLTDSYLKPFGPAFKPAGKNTPVAGLTATDPFTAPPPVTIFST